MIAYYRFLRCVVEVDEEHKVAFVRFVDGVYTKHEADGHYARAEALGYGRDLWAEERDRALAFAWLANEAGLAWSGAQWKAAHPGANVSASLENRAAEEIAVDEFLAALDKTGSRPWDDMLVLVE